MGQDNLSDLVTQVAIQLLAVNIARLDNLEIITQIALPILICFLTEMTSIAPVKTLGITLYTLLFGMPTQVQSAQNGK